MPITKPETTEKLDEAAQRRLEHWLLSPELEQHMRAAGDTRKPKRTGPYIAISRQTGSDGTLIARLVGKELGWDVLDKEILDFMAQRYDLPRGMLEFVDEAKSNWVHDLLGAFVDSHVISRDKYAAHLQRIICLAALHGHVIFVGRSAHAILPRQSGLSVRVVAPKEVRIQRLMERSSVSHGAAAATITEVDKRRKDFCQHYFHYSIDDPEQYDLLINTARVSPSEAARVIIQAFSETRGDPHLPEAERVPPQQSGWYTAVRATQDSGVYKGKP